MFKGKNVIINCENANVSKTAIINDDVIIEAKKIIIGEYVIIDKNCIMSSVDGFADEIIIGDNTHIYNDCVIKVPKLYIKENVTIHNHVTIYGLKQCSIGYNCWIGQNTILNSNDVLNIGNNVAVAAYSQVWTHAFFGELLEGTPIFKIEPTTIKDDAWIMANSMITQGVTIGYKSIVLAGSVNAKDVPDEKIYGGAPSRDLTNKFPPRRMISAEEKFIMMKTFVHEFISNQKRHYTVECEENNYIFISEKYNFEIIFLKEITNYIKNDVDTIIITIFDNNIKLGRNVSILNLTTKNYVKTNTLCERMFIKFLNSYRARFIPINL